MVQQKGKIHSTEAEGMESMSVSTRKLALTAAANFSVEQLEPAVQQSIAQHLEARIMAADEELRQGAA